MYKLEFDFIRHGQSIENSCEEKIKKGEIDQYPDFLREGVESFPLTAKGRAQMHKIGRKLSLQGRTYDRVFVSAYLRTQQSYDSFFAAYAGSGILLVSPRIEPMINERNFGLLQALSPAQIDERFPFEVERRKRMGRYQYAPPEGESYKKICENRVRPFIERSLKLLVSGGKAEQRWLLISHASAIRCFRLVLEKREEGIKEEEVLEAVSGTPINASLSRFSILVGEQGYSSELIGWNVT